MNEKPDLKSTLPDDDARFDRLVDGELTAAEYRALISSLDDEPSGWRRCALAFLESQALAGELSVVRRGLDLREDSAPTPVPRGIGTALSFGAWNVLAIAASFVLAFGLGVLAPRLFSRATQDQYVAGNNSLPAIGSPLGVKSNGDGVRHQAFRPVGNVRLVVDGPGGEADAGEVPVYEGQDLANFLNDQRPALAPELVELLRRSGHEVQRQQQYVPAQLEDGRQIIVPVEQYQITPVSNRAY
jgi:hypothetical protein